MRKNLTCGSYLHISNKERFGVCLPQVCLPGGSSAVVDNWSCCPCRFDPGKHGDGIGRAQFSIIGYFNVAVWEATQFNGRFWAAIGTTGQSDVAEQSFRCFIGASVSASTDWIKRIEPHEHRLSCRIKTKKYPMKRFCTN